MNWTVQDIETIYTQPFFDLLYEAHTMHRQHHQPHKIQASKLLSIKTGACPEDCGYCAQSGHHKTGLQKERLMSLEAVVESAKAAKEMGATRYCMGAAWRNPPEKSMPLLQAMIREVKALGLETCMTLGMLTEEQACDLKTAGLDYYNHNIDTSPSYYPQVVKTRTFQDRLDTLAHVRDAGINVCCGGILGLGETRNDRFEFLQALANMKPALESVPINHLIPVKGTPLGNSTPLDDIEIVRTIATARMIMPKSIIRLTAGRSEMSDALQAMCFFAGANSIFIGDKLLTEENPTLDKDKALFAALNVTFAERG